MRDVIRLVVFALAVTMRNGLRTNAVRLRVGPEDNGTTKTVTVGSELRLGAFSRIYGRVAS